MEILKASNIEERLVDSYVREGMVDEAVQVIMNTPSKFMQQILIERAITIALYAISE